MLQRGVGFLRSILFCGMLTDDALGRWSLALSFLLLAAPLAVLGLPGSFGRYVEYYRRRGQLRTFLWRTSWVTFAMAAVGTAVVLLAACLRPRFLPDWRTQHQHPDEKQPRNSNRSAELVAPSPL